MTIQELVNIKEFILSIRGKDVCGKYMSVVFFGRIRKDPVCSITDFT